MGFNCVTVNQKKKKKKERDDFESDTTIGYKGDRPLPVGTNQNMLFIDSMKKKIMTPPFLFSTQPSFKHFFSIRWYVY